jgi:hypothetical protein
LLGITATALTKAYEVNVGVVGPAVPLVYVRQSTVNRACKLFEGWIIGHLLACLLQEF